MKNIVLTGVTGFLGSHFLLSLELSSTDKVICLTRGDSEEFIRSRVRSALELAAASYDEYFDIASILDRCVFVSADIESDMCGLKEANLLVIKSMKPDEVWHFAASLNFEDEKSDLIERRNVLGTRNIIRLTKEISAGKLIYISTAYVNGSVSGDVGNVLNNSGKYNNYYEYSKSQAEHIIVEQCQELDIDYRILRPSIVIGVSSTGRTGGSTTGLYGFIREMAQIGRIVRKNHVQARVEAYRDSIINLIPVDQFIRDAISVVCSKRDSRIFNLTANKTLGFGDIFDAIHEALDLRGISMTSALDKPTPLEETVKSKTVFYSSYIKGEVRFIRSIDTDAGINHVELKRFVKSAVDELERSEFERVMPAREAAFGDLSLFRTGEENDIAVVIVNAFGMPNEFWTPIAKSLASSFDVVTWTLRDYRDGRRSTIEDHVGDLERVIRGIGKPAHLVSWCSGCGLVIRALAGQLDSVLSAAFISGGYSLRNSGLEETEYERVIRKMFRKAKENSMVADLLYKTIFSSFASVDIENYEYGEDDMNTVLASVNPRYVSWTSSVYKDLDSFTHYAHQIDEFVGEHIDQFLGDIDVPTFFIAGDRDQTVNYMATEYVAGVVGGAVLDIIPGCDHFALHSEPSIAAKVKAFFLEHNKQLEISGAQCPA